MGVRVGGERELGASAELRAGVAGAGVFGGYHADKYALTQTSFDNAASCNNETSSENASLIDGGAVKLRLTSIYDVDLERAKALADKHHADAYDDYNLFLNSIDMLTIATPAPTHGALALEAIAAGKHCLIEKPIALNVDQARQIAALAQDKDVAVQIGHQERFVTAAQGLFGVKDQARSITFNRCGPASGRCEDVSAVFDLMIHDLDLARQFDFGTPETVDVSGDEHSLTARLSFDGGRNITLTASRRAEQRARSIKIETQAGLVDFDFLSRTVANETGSALVSDYCEQDIEAVMADPLGFGVARFVRAAAGLGPVGVSAHDGLCALEWACMIEQARLGSP